MSNILVSYFSASGNTRRVALKLAEAIGADLFEIEPADKYTDADLDWTNIESRTTIEMKDRMSRPKIKNKVDNLDSYDKVVLGFPIWWYTAPTIINTFIEENNLEGKEIYVFVTSGGSNVNEGMDDLIKKYTNLNFVKGLRFTGNEDEESFESLLN